jgi:hypothetical protein
VHAEPEPDETAQKAEYTEDQDEPNGPVRQLTVIAWTIVAIVAIFAVLVFIELGSINDSLTAAACIKRAEANFAVSSQPHQSAQAAGLGRLALHIALGKCGS